MSSGIYQIRNIINGKRYIGSAIDFRCRWRQHQNHANKGIHHSAHFQAAWNKYGAESFIFEILIACQKDEILDYEQITIDRESPEYNIAKSVSAPMLGLNHNERAKELIAASKRGKKHSPERIKKNAEGHKGIPAWNKGKKMSAELCAVNSAVHKGKVLSLETRKKISDSNKGQKRSQTYIKIVSERMKGNQFWLGKKHSKEWKIKTSQRMTQYHEHNGISNTSKKWAQIFGITTKAFAARLRRWGNVDRIYVPRMQ